MSETKHTPGPWVVKSARSGFYVESQFDVIVESLDEYGRYGAIDDEANARLIAAAPELLEALKSIAEFWNRDQNEEAMIGACWHAVETAEAAIAKAEGVQP